MERYRTIRQLGSARFMTIPIDIFRAYGLEVGDTALWSAEGEVVTLRFFKNRTPASMEQDVQKQDVQEQDIAMEGS